ncbi:VOC family protein [Paeniglutamicibacter gangotriensis]|uniref:VOC family protein n=1 Tax=Paeniglutamicibacter gangotriensis TaxID=254787 RepID=A0A5B0E3I3_9MICC|nr:VOC family protein [Paeniglutamicibacter gangotriensis]KAA0973226.1 VOC family protein [Paeniglutamicibacter gangotriensis]
MEILSSRVLLRPVNLPETQAFYRDVLGLAIAREFGTVEHRGVVFFLGNGLLEVAGSRAAVEQSSLVLWLQVRDVQAELLRLAGLGVTISREARTEPWGLIEGWIRDPDGTKIVLVQVPADHPIRRDVREI